MSQILKQQMCITKFLRPRNTLKKLHFNFDAFGGDCRIDVITFS